MRDNILFGRPFEQQLYDRVVSACALDTDIAAMPAGDATELGERGINVGSAAVHQSVQACLLHNPHQACLLGYTWDR